MHFDAIIIGGGAAGLFCAIEAGKRGRRVLVIERNAQVGRKILISGGGRCNFTNLNVSAENFVSQNSHFAKSALARYTPSDFVKLVRKHKIDFYEKKLGQLFCRESSRQIVDLLLAECGDVRVKIKTGCSVGSVTKNGHFLVGTDQGDFATDNLVIATGGLSFQKVGATDLGYRIASQFGLSVVETRASLVPMIFDGLDYRSLSGIAIDASVSTDGTSFRENILFTHRGLSGPAILQISNYWDKNRAIKIGLVPGIDWHDLFKSNRTSSKRLDNLLSSYLPSKLAIRFAEENDCAKPLRDLSDKKISHVADRLSDWEVMFKDSEGYDKAEVTLGGVSTDELSSKTMESKKVAGLYFIGEVVDVTGWLGGYNFQWAWSSGYATGQVI